MSEIYWITRLDSINVTLSIILTFGVIASLFLLAGTVIKTTNKKFNDKYGDDTDYLAGCVMKKVSLPFVIAGCIALALNLFVPTTKEALMIYGLGGTIDYIKSNDKAKQLPDKVVDALTRYVDNIEKEDKDNNNN